MRNNFDRFVSPTHAGGLRKNRKIKGDDKEHGASLARLELFATDPQSLADHYAKTFELASRPVGDAIACAVRGRELLLVNGPANQLRRASYRFHDAAQFAAHRETLRSRGLTLIVDAPGEFVVCDPEGRQIGFLAPQETPAGADDRLEARLQHFGIRSPCPAALTDFYVGTLGLLLSDRVLDDKGDLTAAFLRTDSELRCPSLFGFQPAALMPRSVADQHAC